MSLTIDLPLVKKLIAEQFSEFSELSIQAVEFQGHDNRSYRLGDNMLIRLPSQDCYALAVQKEQKYLPLFRRFLNFQIPILLKSGKSSLDYPFNFSIYKWLEGKSLNRVFLDEAEKDGLAFELAKFLKQLQSIDLMDGPLPGQHNWWRGAHISFYDACAKEQFLKLAHIIDYQRAIHLWEDACKTKWGHPSVWVHGDIATGNLLIKNKRLSGIIDFGCIGVGDPAYDLTIAWTFFSENSRNNFINEMNLDSETWLRAKAWCLWKSTFELCQPDCKDVLQQKNIIDDLLRD